MSTTPNPFRPYKAIIAAVVASLSAVAAYATELPQYVVIGAAILAAGLVTFITPAD